MPSRTRPPASSARPRTGRRAPWTRSPTHPPQVQRKTRGQPAGRRADRLRHRLPDLLRHPQLGEGAGGRQPAAGESRPADRQGQRGSRRRRRPAPRTGPGSRSLGQGRRHRRRRQRQGPGRHRQGRRPGPGPRLHHHGQGQPHVLTEPRSAPASPEPAARDSLAHLRARGGRSCAACSPKIQRVPAQTDTLRSSVRAGWINRRDVLWRC